MSSAGRLHRDDPLPGVVRLTVDNPGKRNALDHAILGALAETLPALHARCVLITAVGSIFSAGYDIGNIPDSTFSQDAEALVARPFTAGIEAIEAYPYPTVAALPGAAIGGGLELALACDLRVAADSATFGMPPGKLGLVYSHTGLRMFIDAIGAPRTRELFYVGGRIDASTALGWGLVNAVVEPDALEAHALELCAEITGNAPLSLSGNKRIVGELLRAEGALDPGTEAELIALRRACFQSEDMREGVRAFEERRAPVWQGR